ncbi:hypothetical protein ACHAXR_011627 [Thalassiosira sp. AJA248-18]
MESPYDTFDDSVGDDVSADIDDALDEGQSDHSSECCSSSEESSGESCGESDGDDPRDEADDDGYDDIDDSHYDDHDLCNMNHLHPDEDTKTHKYARNRMIVLILSTLLAVLLFNFGYQLFRLVNANDNNDNNDPQAVSHNQQKKKGSEKNADADNIVTKRQRLEDHIEYKMPQYPTRIFTHAALSSKNYRAGGVLSDEMLHRFEEDGVVVIRNLVSPKLLDRLDLASQMLIEGQDEASKKTKRGKQFHMVKNGAIFLGVPPPPNDETTCTTNADNDGGTCEADTEAEGTNDNIILSSFRDLAMYSKIPRVAASLLRLDELREGGEENLKPDSKRRRRQQKEKEQNQAEEDYGDGPHIDDTINLRICRDIFLTKDDDPYACGWHVDDTGFWPSLASDPGVNAWVALDDFPAPRSGMKQSTNSSNSTTGSPDNSSHDKRSSPVATFALSLGSHRAQWRHEAYQVTGSTHTVPTEGYQSAVDLIQRRSGSGTCNIQTSAPDLYEKLEKNKVIYDLKRGDVIFHDRWVFHRTVTVGEYDKMANGNPAKEHDVGAGKPQPATQSNKIFRRYSIRYAPGTAVVPPGYGVEPSVLHNYSNANSTLDEIVERSGPWYPKVWPHVLKRKPLESSGTPGVNESEEEIEGITELVHEKMPKAEILLKQRKKEIQRILSMRGGQ